MPIMLSPHFSLEELVASQTAARESIPNVPNQLELANLTRLCTDALEPIRKRLGHPVLVSSGFRSRELNQAIGGSTSSAHCLGLAADFTCPGFGSPYEICLTLEPMMQELGLDQLIYEYAAWVHVGLREEAPRYMALTIDEDGTRYGIA